MLAACGSAEAPEPPPTAWVPPRAPEDAVAIPAPEGGVGIWLEQVGVGQGYQVAFAEPERLAALAQGIAPCVSGSPRLSVTYDGPTRMGRIALVLHASELTCRGTVGEDGVVDLGNLAKLTAPLAAWRNRTAALTDMRLYAFRTALHVTDAWGHATLWLDGQDPIEGTAYARCVGLDGFDRCPYTREASRDGVLRYPLDDVRLANRLKDLLGPVSP